LNFEESERPLGVQLFGADPDHLAMAARSVVEWVCPDFIDLNFGCPVNKVVSKNGGSSLLRDCPLLEKVARSVVQAVAPFPVTAKIRIGWDQTMINATTTAKILEDAGIQVLAVHGRTKEQGYSGEADWETIAKVVGAVKIPVIGNGDIATASEAKRRREQSGVAGIMIGRGAMSTPWIFREIKHYMATGQELPPPSLETRWNFIRYHCQLGVEQAARGNELNTMHAMRARLTYYSHGMPGAKTLRGKFQQVSSLGHLDAIATEHIEANR